ncbi:MAG: adenylosuccinate synthetase [Candidatus Woesearchaeota archaeon]
MPRKPVRFVVGAQWGDEGKGKITDILTKKMSDKGGGVVSRSNAGPNAGHSTKFMDENGNLVEITSHQLPQGLNNENNIGYTGTGAVVLPSGLRKEIEDFKSSGHSLKNRYFIHPFTSTIQPTQQILDGGSKSKSIGTTGKGVGPTYADQKDRTFNLKIYDAVNRPDFARDLMLRNAEYRGADVTEDDIKRTLDNLAFLKEFVTDNKYFLKEKFEDGAQILFEGANGLLLDNIYGDGKYVTSSNVRPSAAFLGSDLPKTYDSKVIGVAKALQSKVGAGFFPSVLGGKQAQEDYYNNPQSNWISRDEIFERFPVEEINPDLNDFYLGLALGAHANEFGVTTGRPRQVGPLDMVLLKDACKFGGVDSLVLNSVDMMKFFNDSIFSGIPIVEGYIHNGENVSSPPIGTYELGNVEPIYKVLEGFSEDITGAKSFDELPKNARNFVSYIKNDLQTIGVGLDYIGVGPRRDQLISVPKNL